jgi:hypothetical protein
MNKRIIEGVLILIIVLITHLFAEKYSLYYIFKHSDWILHFFGGIGVALIASSFVSKSRAQILGIVLAVGIIWEIYERIGHRFLPVYINFGGPFDTSMDILCAILGASLVLLATRE